MFNDLSYSMYEQIYGRRLPSFPTAIQAIPKNDQVGVDQMILVTYQGDVYMVQFYGRNKAIWPKFKQISVNQNDLMNIH